MLGVSGGVVVVLTRTTEAAPCTATLSRPTNQTADVINSTTRSPGGPRASGPAPPSVNYEGRPVHLSLHLLAFPLPHTFRFYFHGPAINVSRAVARDQLHIDCWNTFAVYAVTCNITVDRTTLAWKPSSSKLPTTVSRFCKSYLKLFFLL